MVRVTKQSERTASPLFPADAVIVDEELMRDVLCYLFKGTIKGIFFKVILIICYNNNKSLF